MAICNGAKCRNREQEMSIKAKNFLPCLFSLYVLVVLLPLFVRVDAYTITCNGSVGDCTEEVEMLMQSEISRRFLAQNQRIHYGPMKPDQPVCGSGANGQSYTDSCVPPRSNSPKRGCFKIYHCPG
ncbi:Ralf-like [Thalictrum thalictroides]|uniref:Ralf-like n=1 Tax=Thalictrum thalictroides TaxID=46969 RepID=A0A7J6V2D8_THATH|nr:Ralf-like [Thalictrum thalictroides]